MDAAFESYKTEYGFPLDPEQSIACRTVHGKVLLLAVPGSGKTTVMIARLGYMTRVLGIHPRSILAVTYSVAGTKEMQKRYKAHFGSCDIEFRTINGLCAKLINAYEKIRGRHAFELIENDGDTSMILRSILASSGAYPTENELREVKSAITYCKNQMLSEKEISEQMSIEGRDFPEIYKAYEAYKRERRLMDYDDQLVYGYKILKTCPDVNAAYSDNFKYICVDEAQDTSRIQHLMLRELADRCGNLFMVGDEDQSIYGFRAAYPQALLEFDKTYPDAKILSIGNNYRSTAKIVKAAEDFIKLNTERRGTDKTMKTKNSEGEAPKRIKLSDVRLLPDYIRRIATERYDGSTAVLFRLNDSMLPIIDILSSKELPFRVRGGDGLFFTHSTVSDVMNILRLASDPYDSELFRRLYYKLSLGITKAELERALAYNSGDDMLPFPEYLSGATWLPERKRSKAARLRLELQRINTSDTYEAMRTIFFGSTYGNYYAHRTSDTVKRDVLLALSYRYRTRNEFFERLKELEGEVKRGSVSGEGIVLSTIHSAKGMEFDRVILCDCKDGVLPSISASSSLNDDERHSREEDRRLFYVGVTRAKKHLELVSWESEFGSEGGGWEFIDVFFGKPVGASGLSEVKKATLSAKKRRFDDSAVMPKYSRSELERMAKDYYEGVSVRHKVFGFGVITGVKGGFVQIKFSRYPIPKKLELITCLENGLISEAAE